MPYHHHGLIFGLTLLALSAITIYLSGCSSDRSLNNPALYRELSK